MERKTFKRFGVRAVLSAAVLIFLIACGAGCSPSQPGAELIGKWKTLGEKRSDYGLMGDLEFFKGTTVEQKQSAVGTFCYEVIDATHVKFGCSGFRPFVAQFAVVGDKLTLKQDNVTHTYSRVKP